jgi:hypothetical protein
MGAKPLIEEVSGGTAGAMIAGLAGLPAVQRPPEKEQNSDITPSRRLSIYPASAGFDLVEELEFLSARALESNVFFNPRFLAPAMPRIEDREVRLAVIRDNVGERSRLRLLVPFSIEKPPMPFGTAIMRTWSNPFGPTGSPLLDRDDPPGVLGDFFDMLARPHLDLPRVLVLPQVRLKGPVASMIGTVTEQRSLPVMIVNREQRPFLESDIDGDDYLRQSVRPHHFRGLRRLKRRLAEQGNLEHKVARTAEDVRYALEGFLALEASGWKGRERSAMATDRLRAAFAREAVNRLAERDMCRIHTLTLDGEPIASLIVFIEAGIAYAWKTAYDETLSRFSPGMLLMVEVTKTHLDDPGITATDSCAVPDHPVMSRLWSERREIGTIIIGVTPDADRQVRQAASQLHLYRETRTFARILRKRLRKLLGG